MWPKELKKPKDGYCHILVEHIDGIPLHKIRKYRHLEINLSDNSLYYTHFWTGWRVSDYHTNSRIINN